MSLVQFSFHTAGVTHLDRSASVPQNLLTDWRGLKEELRMKGPKILIYEPDYTC